MINCKDFRICGCASAIKMLEEKLGIKLSIIDIQENYVTLSFQPKDIIILEIEIIQRKGTMEWKVDSINYVASPYMLGMSLK